ncbi:unnamed protein product [Eruca vesicaria subsp. sativa]|uniref:EF-hand domain-containing protein n=1 Tax=Eruca vesicaria subsp. sativa TaxID=29727 RepID=A0ABC8J0T6_ERUVS|nr:unnamed protein product [Eruca vesicaria subsp. sativa]
MSGYPPTSQGYGYGSANQPPPPYSSGGNNPSYGSSPYAVPYGAPKPSSSSAPPSAPSYGAAPPSAPYAPPPSAPYAPPSSGDYKPQKEKPYGGYGAQPPQPGPSDYSSYGAAPAQPGYGAPPKHGPSDYGSYGSAPPRPAQPGYGAAQPRPGHGGYGGYPPQGSYGSPFASLIPSGFAPGTDPNIVACFQAADQDGSGFIDDKELQGALSSYQQRFSMRTVHLLMYLFTNSNAMKIGPKEFTALFYSLQNWRSIFERSDKDRSGRIDVNELRDALMSLGFSVSPGILDLLVSKFDKSGGKNRAIEYDNFIECCLTVKGLTEKFKEKDTGYSGSATFTYDTFMLTVLPFLIA